MGIQLEKHLLQSLGSSSDPSGQSRRPSQNRPAGRQSPERHRRKPCGQVSSITITEVAYRSVP